jgi:purine-binding chemotaxis protein CheW
MAEQQFNPGTEDVLLLGAAGDCLALPAANVMEIIRPPVTTRVPHSPPNLLGLANVRGAVLPIISLTGLVGNEQSPASATTRVVVVKGRTTVGLLVDEVKELTNSAKGRRIDLEALLNESFRPLTRLDRKGQPPVAEIAAPEETAADELVFLAFTVRKQQYALPLNEIVGIAALPEVVASLPRTDTAMIGVAEIDGSLVPLVSAAVLLGLAPDETGRHAGRVVLIRLGDTRVGLVVDRLKEIVRVSPGDLDTVPTVLTRGIGEAQVEAICRLDEGRRLISILAPAQLFDAETVTRVLAHAEHGGQAMSDGETDAAETEQFIVFSVGGETYGLPIGYVDEIVRCPDRLTRVPRAPAFVAGLINLRGKAIPIIDQRQRFAVAGHGDGARRRIVVVTTNDLQVGFLVDNVSEVVTLASSDLSPAPDLSETAAVIDRVAMVEREGRLILLVDPKALLDRAERDVLSALSDEAEAPRPL